MSRESDIDLVSEKLDELFESLRLQEPKNADLYYNLSRLFARFCGRKEVILKKTMHMMELALLL